MCVGLIGCEGAAQSPADDDSDRVIPPSSPPPDAPRNEIVFLSNREGGPLAQARHELWAVRADATGERQITDDDVVQNIANFTYSPDSASILFEGMTGRIMPALDIMMIDVNGGTPVNLTRSLERWRPDESKPWFTDGRWAPDRSTIAIAYMHEQWSIQLLAPDGSYLRTLAGHDGTLRDWKPRWSPDGREITFLSNRRLPQFASHWQLFVTNIVTGTVRHLSTNVAWASDGVWSPDGRTIAFSGGPGIGNHSLYALTALDGAIRRLVQGQTATMQEAILPVWHPDGRSLTFTDVRPSTSEIFVVNADGTGLRRVTYLHAPISRDPVFSPEGTHIAFSSDLGGSSGIYVVRLSDLRVWRVTTERFETRPAWLPTREAGPASAS